MRDITVFPLLIFIEIWNKFYKNTFKEGEMNTGGRKRPGKDKTLINWFIKYTSKTLIGKRVPNVKTVIK